MCDTPSGKPSKRRILCLKKSIPNPMVTIAGMATGLVSSLTKELLDRNIVPFYSASVTNVGSQLVAVRSGYLPAWVDTYGTVLDGSSVYSEILDNLTATYL